MGRGLIYQKINATALGFGIFVKVLNLVQMI